LAVTELFGKEMHCGVLGPATIVGSASFNLFMIIGLCIFIIPSTEIRKVDEVPVFVITVIFMFMAYLWLVLIVAVITPEVITIEEAVITLLMEPALVWISYLADIGKFGNFGKAMEVRSEDVERACELLGEFDRDTQDALKSSLASHTHLVHKLKSPSASDMAELRKICLKNKVNKKSRATRRVEATRAMTGGKKVLWNASPTHGHVTRVIGVTEACIQDVPLALAKGSGPSLVQLSCENQCMSDDLQVKDICISRTGDLSEKATANFEVVGPAATTQAPVSTSRGSIMAASSTGTLERSSICEVVGHTVTFETGQDLAQVEINRPGGVTVDGSVHEFFVELTMVSSSLSDSVKSKLALGSIKKSLVVMRPAGKPGRLSFAYERLLIQGAEKSQILQVMVQRTDGCSGPVSCSYRTERLQAVPGFDFTELEGGKLEFAAGVTEMVIEVEILPKEMSRANNEFLLILEDAEGADFIPDNDGGADSEILTIEIGPRDLLNSHLSERMVRWLDERVNFNEVLLGNHAYRDQILGAIFCNGSYEDQQEASKMDWAFHLIALPWKLLFSIVPPTAYCGGWVCFYLSLVFIGALTAVIGDLATLFGCVIGMPDLLTAISFVALGTSMPDLFASKTAAIQDTNADASIVNVTGSNSVNVFLGLGLPWTVGAIYWHLKEWDEHWAFKYPDIAKVQRASKEMVFVVKSGDLVFSVIVFNIAAVLACTILVVRRRKVGGELGGPQPLKTVSAVTFAMLWFISVGVCGWWSLRQDQASSDEKTAILVVGGLLMVIPVIVSLLVAAKSKPLPPPPEEAAPEPSAKSSPADSRPETKNVTSKVAPADPPMPASKEPEKELETIKEKELETIKEPEDREPQSTPEKVLPAVLTNVAGGTENYSVREVSEEFKAPMVGVPAKVPPQEPSDEKEPRVAHESTKASDSLATFPIYPVWDEKQEDPELGGEMEKLSSNTDPSSCCMSCCLTPTPQVFAAKEEVRPKSPVATGGDQRFKECNQV